MVRLLAEERERIETLLRHDCHFTYGENIGSPDCLIPSGLCDWMPTRHPIIPDCFKISEIPVKERRRVFTTVASWEPKEDGPVINGKKFTGKSTELLKFIDMPKRSSIPFEIALSGPAPYDTLKNHGWNIIDGYTASKDPVTYRNYLASSFAEWSVGKNAYVNSKSGWFSGRTAGYLASGVPVIVQDTGYSKIFKTGEGVLPFTTPDDCADAIEDLMSRYEVHVSAAKEFVSEYFDSSKVLQSLIDRVNVHDLRMSDK
jgi:hypothetical protein